MKITAKFGLSLLSLLFFNLSYSQPAEIYSQQNDYNYSGRPAAGYNEYDYQPNHYNQGYHPAEPHSPYSQPQKYHDGNQPQSFDWDYHQSWRDNRKAYYDGETQPEAYRHSHPTGAAGIGYDADPTYTQIRNEYERQMMAEGNFYVAENNRLANRGPGEPQEFYSRGGGGSSQKGRASREASRESYNNQRGYYNQRGY